MNANQHELKIKKSHHEGHEKLEEKIATKKHKKHKKILSPAKAQRRRDFKTGCGYSVDAGRLFRTT